MYILTHPHRFSESNDDENIGVRDSKIKFGKEVIHDETTNGYLWSKFVQA